VEAEWLRLQQEEHTVPVYEARRGHELAEGRFEVLGRLGQRSKAFALVVKDDQQPDQLLVLKVAADEELNDRVANEAVALDGLVHPAIVCLMDDQPLLLDGRAAILLSCARPRRDTLADERPRTLAARLAREPIGVELA
jgi:hypothetical protein